MTRLEIQITIDLPRCAASLVSGAGQKELLQQECERIVADLEGYEHRHGCRARITGHLTNEHSRLTVAAASVAGYLAFRSTKRLEPLGFPAV